MQEDGKDKIIQDQAVEIERLKSQLRRAREENQNNEFRAESATAIHTDNGVNKGIHNLYYS